MRVWVRTQEDCKKIAMRAQHEEKQEGPGGKREGAQERPNKERILTCDLNCIDPSLSCA